jgi:uncharacterized protein YjbI with pentapeptide repeats
MYVLDKKDPIQKIVVRNSNISGSEFINCTASDLIFNCMWLTNLKIEDANVSGMKLNDVNLTGLNITDADLSELVIEGAQWGGAHFNYVGYGNKSRPDSDHNKQGVRFSNCSFENGTLADCNFTNAKLDNCKIEGLTINGVSIEKLLEVYHSLSKS